MSSEIKALYTPGPWHTGGIGGEGHEVIVYAKNGYAVANAVTHHGRSEVGEMVANAALLAAAPELLAACELLLGRLDEDEDRNAKWIGDTARAAIAKALGG